MRHVGYAVLSAAALCASIAFPAAAQDVLRGHGGPVRALSVRADAREVVSGSFDTAVIVWDLQKNSARRVLRFHEGAVNAVATLPGGCVASAGEDRRIAIWCGDGATPQKVLSGHEAPITALTSVQDRLVSGSFDGTVRLWDPSGASTKLAEHAGAVTAVAVPASTAAGRVDIVSAGADGALLRTSNGVTTRIVLAASVAAIALAPDGEIIAASADGHVRFVNAAMQSAGDIELDGTPLSSLALSPDGRLIATAGLRGGVAIIERASRKILHRMTGPGLPVWSLAFDTDNRTLFTGGADRLIRRWDAVEGRPLSSTIPEPVAQASSERGAVVFRACQACHTLTSDEGPRAGPSLAGLFGRRIATAPGYMFSPALQRMDIVWTAETVAKLFEVGPTVYTPGTKMPEQTITDPADRQALVEWLAKATK